MSALSPLATLQGLNRIKAVPKVKDGSIASWAITGTGLGRVELGPKRLQYPVAKQVFVKNGVASPPTLKFTLAFSDKVIADVNGLPQITEGNENDALAINDKTEIEKLLLLQDCILNAIAEASLAEMSKSSDITVARQTVRGRMPDKSALVTVSPSGNFVIGCKVLLQLNQEKYDEACATSADAPQKDDFYFPSSSHFIHQEMNISTGQTTTKPACEPIVYPRGALVICRLSLDYVSHVQRNIYLTPKISQVTYVRECTQMSSVSASTLSLMAKVVNAPPASEDTGASHHHDHADAQTGGDQNNAQDQATEDEDEFEGADYDNGDAVGGNRPHDNVDDEPPNKRQRCV